MVVKEETMGNTDLKFCEIVDFLDAGFLARRKEWGEGTFIYKTDEHVIPVEYITDDQVYDYLMELNDSIKKVTVAPECTMINVDEKGSVYLQNWRPEEEDISASDWEFIITNKVADDLQNMVKKFK